MPASLIDGRAVAELRKEQLKIRVRDYAQKQQRAPGLAVILIGTDPASVIYVNNKRKACAEAGIASYFYDLEASTSQKKLVQLIEQLNEAEHIDGILIQLPLPQHINTALIIEKIKPEKDVDGFHPYNLGRLAQRNPLLRPCTPLGIINLLNHYQLNVEGKHAVVVGASNIVGRPMSLEFLLAGATVSICHRFTKNLQSFINCADIVVVAAGLMDVVSYDWLQAHQIIIDVGIHRLTDGSIRGDINFSKALERVSWLTPVPGGVGPMTIITLLENTMMAAEQNQS